MAFAISIHRFKQIGSFNQAENFFAQTKPVRSPNWHANQRPLDNRSAYHKRIQHYTAPDGVEVYELVLYDTPLVSYYSDGRVVVIGHPSNSSQRFLSSFLPQGIWAIRRENVTLFEINSGPDLQWYQGACITFRRDTDANTWVLCGAHTPRIHCKLNLKKAAQIRKAAKPFLIWVKATRALLNNNGPRTWYGACLPTSIEDLANQELWPKMEPGVANSAPSIWVQGAYQALGAYDTITLTPFDPPPRR